MADKCLGKHFGSAFMTDSKRKKCNFGVFVQFWRTGHPSAGTWGTNTPGSAGRMRRNPRAAAGLRHSRGPGFDAGQHSRGGAQSGGRCMGGQRRRGQMGLHYSTFPGGNPTFKGNLTPARENSQNLPPVPKVGLIPNSEVVTGKLK